MGNTLIVDIGNCKVTNDPEAELITYSLGSCIGVAIWDPQALVGGLLHYMLSSSTVAPDRARTNPAIFADTGIPLLFKSAYELGASKKRLQVKVAGGASLFSTGEQMNIGKHNYVTLRKIFWKNGVLIDGEHVGDSISRTMRLHVGTGCVTVENRRMSPIKI